MLPKHQSKSMGEVVEIQDALGSHSAAVSRMAKHFQEERFVKRLWQKDPSLWTSKPESEIENRLGWLELASQMQSRCQELLSFREEVQKSRLEQVVLLGMGGSSLAPEVFRATFGLSSLIVLDSTHPEAVRSVWDKIALDRTLFLVSSKSGGTVETLSLFRFFWEKVSQKLQTPGEHFVAITDPRSPLEQLAHSRSFRRCFLAPADVGGRYSALSVFGLVPAMLLGLPVLSMLERAERVALQAKQEGIEGSEHPFWLGAVLAALYQKGINKVSFQPSPQLASFPLWLEQLIAESTGKNGQGILPIVEEPRLGAGDYSPDHLFVFFRLKEDQPREEDTFQNALQKAGQPLLTFLIPTREDLGGEMVRWEIAVATASAALGIHPFNQPDVQRAKELAKEAMATTDRELEKKNKPAYQVVKRGQELSAVLDKWVAQRGHGSYLACLAYLFPSAAMRACLHDLRQVLQQRFGRPTTLGFGPRYLHSTGQFHKGGPNTGIFIQLIADPAIDYPIPETNFTFARLLRAQAEGDARALCQAGRLFLQIDLEKKPLSRLSKLLSEMNEG